MGDRSVPITSADGNWSAKSLSACQCGHGWPLKFGGATLHTLPIFPSPSPHPEHAAAGSITLCGHSRRVLRKPASKAALLTWGLGPIGARKSLSSRSSVNMWWLGWRSEQTPLEERKMRRVPYVQLIILRLVVWAPEIAVSGVGRN
jgi:hypothetical protein